MWQYFKISFNMQKDTPKTQLKIIAIMVKVEI